MEEEKIKGMKLSHLKFGNGIVISLSGNYLKIEFSSGMVKVFKYPDSFENFLKPESNVMLDDIEKDLSKRKLEQDYIDQKNSQKGYAHAREFTKRKKEEQERKKQLEIEKHRQAQKMREQRMQYGNNTNSWGR
ncbi:MAG: hypothetical protein LBS02_10215 [Hungatella sp.]|jgi:hypothetical protein|nr:hypothetical protein [Hungatella sp.]